MTRVRIVAAFVGTIGIGLGLSACTMAPLEPHSPQSAQDTDARSAEAVLKEGLAAAKADDKLVLLHFGAPWCVYCRKLDAWLARDDVRARIGRAYVNVKIDVDNMSSGPEIFERYRRGSKDVGLPWMAIVSPDSADRAMATSEARSGNIGFPGTPEEIAYFIAMLEHTSKKLDARDLDALRATFGDF